MKQIPYRDWHRYAHAEFMKHPAIPIFHLQYELDVTALRHYTKSRNLSFYFSLIWCVAKVIEQREDFRWRLRGDTVVLIDSPEPSFTDIMAGTDLYKIVNAGPAGDDMAAYARRARETADAQTFFFPPPGEESRDDFTYFSCTPMATCTGLVQTVDTDKDNFIPAIAWSRWFERDGRLLLPFTFACNHRLADGLHVSRFFLDIEEAIKSPHGF